MDSLAKLVVFGDVVQVGDSSARPTLGGLGYRLLGAGVACIDQATPESGPQSAPCHRLCTTNGGGRMWPKQCTINIVEMEIKIYRPGLVQLSCYHY